MTYYLAIDIGASSGRHVLVYLDINRLAAEEIYRFDNQMTEKDGSLCWDVDKLFNEVLRGIKKCKETGRIPCSISIDTWGVDYVLLDKNDKILSKTYAYRDARTQGADKTVQEIIPDNELYKRTGIQKQLFNTIYQLTAGKILEPDILEKANSFLMIPDYLHYKLTGIKTNEYTNATTTGLINCRTNNWDFELIEMLELPRHIFNDLKMPTDYIGEFTENIKNEVGFNCKVTACATHDTGSAVIAAPVADEKSLYLSSGTWSLLGIENTKPIVSDESRTGNFTNEGGIDYRYRYLKNIMGLWMVQCVYREFDEKYSYAEISKRAEMADIDTIVDCNDKRFFAPDSMTEEIKQYARETNQKIPSDIGGTAAVVYNSLAVCYKDTIGLVEKLTGKTFDTINIIGGGANAEYLNEVTAKVTGCRVAAGPAEATSIGNALCQMLANGEFKDIDSARECVEKSFDLKEYGGGK